MARLVVSEYKTNICLALLSRIRPWIPWSYLGLCSIKTEIWLHFIIVIYIQAPLHLWRRLVVIMHLVPAPTITNQCGEDDKKLFGLLSSPRGPPAISKNPISFYGLSLKKAETYMKERLSKYFCRHLFLAKLWLLGGKRSHHTNLVRDFSRNSQTHAELR